MEPRASLLFSAARRILATLVTDIPAFDHLLDPACPLGVGELPALVVLHDLLCDSFGQHAQYRADDRHPLARPDSFAGPTIAMTPNMRPTTARGKATIPRMGIRPKQDPKMPSTRAASARPLS
jgi:hypothetical protein